MVWKKTKETEPEEEKPVLPTFKKSEKKERTLIVKELPLRPVRGEEIDGEMITYITIEEALTEILQQIS